VAGTFTCPDCTDTYQPHWRDPNGTNLCRSCADYRAGRCAADNHPQHLDEHPCTQAREEPGTPCRWCGAPVPMDGKPCPQCTISFEGMSLADIKAVFAADGTFSLGGLGKGGGDE
jgi:hypothetical protein